jgi:hypothetical protein
MKLPARGLGPGCRTVLVEYVDIFFMDFFGQTVPYV